MFDDKEYLIRKSECDRIKVIYNELIPSITNSAYKKEIKNIKYIINIHLPKLRANALKLSNRCVKDEGCNVSCNLCDPIFIEQFFDDTIKEIEKIL